MRMRHAWMLAGGLLLATSWGASCALNPQPEPPGAALVNPGGGGTAGVATGSGGENGGGAGATGTGGSTFSGGGGLAGPGGSTGIYADAAYGPGDASTDAGATDASTDAGATDGAIDQDAQSIRDGGADGG